MVQDCVAIPLSNYSQSIMVGLFDISFTHVPAKNAKPFEPLFERSEGIEARIMS